MSANGQAEPDLPSIIAALQTIPIAEHCEAFNLDLAAVRAAVALHVVKKIEAGEFDPDALRCCASSFLATEFGPRTSGD